MGCGRACLAGDNLALAENVRDVLERGVRLSTHARAVEVVVEPDATGLSSRTERGSGGIVEVRLPDGSGAI